MSDKDGEVRKVVAELDALLAQLGENVAALNAILDPQPALAGDGPDEQERAR